MEKRQVTKIFKKWHNKWTVLHQRGSRDVLDPQMKHVCHGYADHLVIDEPCSYFAQAYTLIQRVASSSSKLLLYVTFQNK